MKKSFFTKLLFLIAVVIISCTTIYFYSPYNEPTIDIFYAPHQDDETLSMGTTIVQKVQEGHEVHIVLLTQGGASKAINTVNKALEAEGNDPLTIDEFKDARVNEFNLAVSQLGILKDNIHLYDYPDGSLEVAQVKEVVKTFEEEYPSAKHHVFSYYDPHPDHKATGQALLDLKLEGRVRHVNFFIPRYVNLEHIGKLSSITPETSNIAQKALEAYGIWDPKNEFYSIGHLSVQKEFELIAQDSRNRFHGHRE